MHSVPITQFYYHACTSILLIIIISHLSVFVRGIRTGYQPGVNCPFISVSPEKYSAGLIRIQAIMHNFSVLDSSRLKFSLEMQHSLLVEEDTTHSRPPIINYWFPVLHGETMESMWDGAWLLYCLGTDLELLRRGAKFSNVSLKQNHT